MAHIILLGDSIFDNAAYVPDGLPVIEQVRQCLSNSGDRASLLAVDGDCIHDVPRQLKQLPVDATHLFISVGGNDALRYAGFLRNTSASLSVALQQLASMKTEFSQRYQGMLETVLVLNQPTVICTIYDQCPTLDPGLRLLAFTALSMFNDCITRQAIQLGLPLIDLRIICSEASDYSSISPIEPSTTGGQKIARCIATVLSQHDFSVQHTVCYT
jgi:hypothetical protein